MSGTPTIIALVEPRSGTRRLDVAIELCRLVDEVLGRSAVLVDMDPQCQLSRLLLEVEQWEVCRNQQKTSGAWAADFMHGDMPPDSDTLRWLNEQENVFFIPGWADLGEEFHKITDFTIDNGFAPNPAEHLNEWLSELGEDVIVLVTAGGWSPLTRLGVAAAETTIAFLRDDPLGVHDRQKIRERIRTMNRSASAMAEVEGIFIWLRQPPSQTTQPFLPGAVLPHDKEAREQFLTRFLTRIL